MNHMRLGAMTFCLPWFILLSATAQDADALKPDEKLFIHAAALMVLTPDNSTGLAEKAMESAKSEKPKWKVDNDALLKALRSIEEKPELRKKYRAELKKVLEKTPKEATPKLVAQIERDFSPGQVAEYRKKVERGAVLCVFPLCIIWDCCP
jgi:hypothetical protein